jgi:hypothetical protein
VFLEHLLVDEKRKILAASRDRDPIGHGPSNLDAILTFL